MPHYNCTCTLTLNRNSLLFLITLGIAIALYRHLNPPLDPSMSLSAIRARHAAKSLAGRVAVVVGGTSGIGEGIALRLAANNASVVIVGRSRQRAESVLARMRALGTGSHGFVPCDATLLSSVASFARSFAAAHPRLDYLVLTQSAASMEGRAETAEGLDTKLALNYYSRVAFILALAPLMAAGEDSRVLSVLSAGVHGPYEGYATDPELKTSFSLLNAANAAGFYNDLAAESLAREHPRISFIHAAPGMVKTNWGAELPWYARGPVRFLQLFFRSKEDSGEYMSCALLDEEYRGGWSLMGPNGERAKPTALQAAARDTVWRHTKEVLERLLK